MLLLLLPNTRAILIGPKGYYIPVSDTTYSEHDERDDCKEWYVLQRPVVHVLNIGVRGLTDLLSPFPHAHTHTHTHTHTYH